ncbi:MAG: hypothetical protein C0624_05965 [Desulfuromonas sp.]|nr:MAG: hypothetical protein C0624_05965 [Desulfuromonas sp.]
MDGFDYPLGIQLWANDARASLHRQQEGYTHALLDNSSDAYRFTAVAGAAKVRDIFHAFAALLGDDAFLILEYYPEAEGSESSDVRPGPQIFYSPYLPINELLENLEPYMERMIHDGFVGFGLANNSAGAELFFSEEKVLTCFSGNHIRIMDLFSKHGLHYDPNQLFPSDFGHDHLSLLCHQRSNLPSSLAMLRDDELDYLNFCADLNDQLEMYPVDESLSFFFSGSEQTQIETVLKTHRAYEDFAEEDFGTLLLDWDDFVSECQASFEGDLWEYRQGLRIRDMIQFVADQLQTPLRDKILDIVADPDDRFRQSLVDRRKRLDTPAAPPHNDPPFWYRGVVRNQGVPLRRDLIRQGWFQA